MAQNGIKFGNYVGIELGSLDGSFDVSTYVNIEGILLVDSLGCTDDKVIFFDEDIILGYTDGEVLGTVIGIVDEITLGLDVETDLGLLDVSFDD